MALLNRDALIEKKALKKEKVDLGNGDFVFVRQMTGKEQETWEHLIMEFVDNKDGKVEVINKREHYRGKIAVCTVCDADGKLLLKAEDAEALSKSMPADQLNKIATAAQRLNKLRDEDEKAMVKNSSRDRVGASSSGSVAS